MAGDTKSIISGHLSKLLKHRDVFSVNASITAELLYNMWLGATLMSKLQRKADGLHQAMQTTTSILTSGTVV